MDKICAFINARIELRKTYVIQRFCLFFFTLLKLTKTYLLIAKEKLISRNTIFSK